jgi:hypothetical protein
LIDQNKRVVLGIDQRLNVNRELIAHGALRAEYQAFLSGRFVAFWRTRG